MVKRYVIGEERMEPHERGSWVSYEDYAALEAECARLREENKMLKDNLKEIEENARDRAWERDTRS